MSLRAAGAATSCDPPGSVTSPRVGDGGRVDRRGVQGEAGIVSIGGELSSAGRL